MVADVDFIVGCFYGDEGKGQVATWLAQQNTRQYRWTARVGAQNAEHRFTHHGCPLTARIFPSASVTNREKRMSGNVPMKVIIGAGHIFNPTHFFREAVHLSIDLRDVYVDPHAMWLTEEHAQSNAQNADSRGSTGWGIGAAAAEKVRRAPGTKLIGDCHELVEVLEDRLCDVPTFLDGISGPGLFEGSQGAMLSLDHGYYPYCTAKNVTVTAMCGELGISHKRIRRVIGVTRLVMMRVPGPSGPTGGDEISFDDVETRTGLRIPDHKRIQGDTARWIAREREGNSRAEEERLFDISMDELMKSHALNGYDNLVVTFADYHRAGNYRVRKWEDLHQDTRELIEEMDREVAPVILIRTGQGEFDYIER